MSPCWRCGRPIVVEGRIGRQALCEGCSSSLHCCKNCKDWDPAAHNQCRESQADYVADREAGNFCNFFKLKVLRPDAPDESVVAKDKLAAAFANLGGAPPPSASPKDADEAKAKLDRAFGRGGGGAAPVPSENDPKRRLED